MKSAQPSQLLGKCKVTPQGDETPHVQSAVAKLTDSNKCW